ncbi:MAG: O-antigen ligase family protein [Flavobacteriales bacterium]|nr:O-antigen ligase family protein [Flavobacteriales bacterium]
MKINIKKYILYSSVFAIFTEAFFFNYIIDWKLLYLIVLSNFLLLLKINHIKFNRNFVFILLGFFIHGLVCYTAIGIPYNFMLSQIIGIAIVGSYFYSVVSLFKTSEIIKVYVKMSLYVAVIGYILYAINYNEPRYRLMSIFKEPAHYVVVVIPACYYYLKSKKYLEFSIIFGTLILSNSSLGYIGCGLMFILPNLTLRRMGYLVALLPIVGAVFYYIYSEHTFFKMRVDDTYNSLKVIQTGKFDEKTNLSSYVMIANMHIAKKNIIDHPLGSGIGSHHYMHTENYLKEMRPPEYLRIQQRHTDNSFDANSLATRLFSEFGLFGIIGVFLFLYYSSTVFKRPDLFFAQGVFIYFLLKLFRDGHYFPPELFLFIWLFYFSVKEQKQIFNNSKTREA